MLAYIHPVENSVNTLCFPKSQLLPSRRVYFAAGQFRHPALLNQVTELKVPLNSK